MKFETKSNDSFSSVLFSFQIPFVKRTIRWHVMLYAAPDTWVTGYTSKTMNGRHILFFDYDHLAFDVLEEEAKYLQEKYSLSDFYIFKMDRPNAFHAVCLDAQSLQKTYKILQDSSADQSFIHAVKNLPYREWCLRIGKKGNRAPPKYLCTIESVDFDFQKTRSSGHASLLKKLNVPIIGIGVGKWDGFKKVPIVEYNTANRTQKE